jgi:hypothetical protein
LRAEIRPPQKVDTFGKRGNFRQFAAKEHTSSIERCYHRQ